MEKEVAIQKLRDQAIAECRALLDILETDDFVSDRHKLGRQSEFKMRRVLLTKTLMRLEQKAYPTWRYS